LHPSSLEAHRRALLEAQNADPDDAERTLDRTLREDTEVRAFGWAFFLGVMSFSLTIAGMPKGTHGWSAAMIVPVLLASLAGFLLVRIAAWRKRTFTATLTQKFITKKKRRPFVVLGGKSFHVSRRLHDLVAPDIHYVVRTNGAGSVVFDVAPEIKDGPYR
jgi:hypothetical protein